MQGEPQHKVWPPEETRRGERCCYRPLSYDVSLGQALVCFLLQTFKPGWVPSEW